MKLYKKKDGEFLYWETWDNDDGKSATVHWGNVGEQGKSKEIFSTTQCDFKDIVQEEIYNFVEHGYDEIDLNDHAVLIIEYKVDGMGTSFDLEKRHAIQDRMQGILGWTGLGHCDGGSIGSGTMEICCLVVDFEIAKQVIMADLEETEFADYTKIYNENVE